MYDLLYYQLLQIIIACNITTSNIIHFSLFIINYLASSAWELWSNGL